MLLLLDEPGPDPDDTLEKRYWVHSDHLGTPYKITDTNKTTLWSWNSDGYGSFSPNEDVDQNGETLTFNLRFPGQYYDIESGLHYNVYRYYEPKSGRYLSSDPIGLTGGMNTYTYANTNPLMYIDPLGLETCLLTVRNSWGLGVHTALYVSTDGGTLYDPAGGYGINNGGEIINVDNLDGFEEYHKGDGDTVQSQCAETTPAQEEAIISEASNRPTATGPTCAINVSDVLNKSNVFSGINSGVFWPGNLSQDFGNATINADE